MDDSTPVNNPARKRPVAVRLPMNKRKLLEAIQADRGDKFLSATITEACDRFIEEHYPGALKGAA